MTWLDWLIVIVPVALLIWISVYSRKYARGVVDFLADELPDAILFPWEIWPQAYP